MIFNYLGEIAPFEIIRLFSGRDLYQKMAIKLPINDSLGLVISPTTAFSNQAANF